MVRLGDMNPSLYDEVTLRMEKELEHLGFDSEDLLFDWRSSARLSRIDRELYETYGPLKDYILHPTTQAVVNYFDQNININIFVEPEIPWTTGNLYYRCSVV